MVVKVTSFMKKEYVLLLAIILSSCSPYRKAETYKEIANKGYIGLEYRFTDSGNRNIEIRFDSDSILAVTNRTNIAQNHYLLNFNSLYSYKMLDIGSIFINKMISSDKG